MAFFLVPALAQAQISLDEGSMGAGHAHGSPAWRDPGLVLLGGALAALAVDSGWSVLLYPIAVLGAGGSLLAFSFVTAVVLRYVASAMTGARVIIRRPWRVDILAIALGVLVLIVLALVRAALLPGVAG